MPREKAPAYQRYPKQIMGDDKVLLMDWDAYGMHNWLLDTSWQQDPRGTIPNDQDALRRWLRLPRNAVICARPDHWCRCNDCTWRRVWPQINAAWPISESGRRGNLGMMRCAKKQENYRNGNQGKEIYMNGTQIGTQIEQGLARKSVEEEKNLTVLEVGFDFELAFEALFEIYPKRKDSPLVRQYFIDAIGKVSQRHGFGQLQASAYILERAKIYASLSKFIAGMDKFLYEQIYEQEPSEWEQKAVKPEIDMAIGSRRGGAWTDADLEAK